MRFLFIVPARKGSKGLPGKNIKVLNDKPLIVYSLQYARLFTNDINICVSTDDLQIAEILRDYKYELPFLRPDELAGDEIGMREVLLHALNWYEKRGEFYDGIVLLQPTSPFRRRYFFEEAVNLYNDSIDMIVAVNESKANPYFNLFEENTEGLLKLSKFSASVSRQQAPPVYQYNGNLYIINPRSLRSHHSLASFGHIKKYVIPVEYGIDIDNSADWNSAEYFLNNHLVKTDGEL